MKTIISNGRTYMGFYKPEWDCWVWHVVREGAES